MHKKNTNLVNLSFQEHRKDRENRNMPEPDFLQIYLNLRAEIASSTTLTEKKTDPVTAMVYYAWKYKGIKDARAIHRLIVVSFDRVLDRLGKLGFMPLYVKVRREKKHIPLRIPEMVDVPQTEEEKLANMMIG